MFKLKLMILLLIVSGLLQFHAKIKKIYVIGQIRVNNNDICLYKLTIRC